MKVPSKNQDVFLLLSFFFGVTGLNNFYAFQRNKAVIKMLIFTLGVICCFLLCDVIGVDIALIIAFLLFLCPLGIVVALEILVDDVTSWEKVTNPKLKIIVGTTYYLLLLLTVTTSLTYLFTDLYLYLFPPDLPRFDFAHKI